jgi:hypothetical protein
MFQIEKFFSCMFRFQTNRDWPPKTRLIRASSRSFGLPSDIQTAAATSSRGGMTSLEDFLELEWIEGGADDEQPEDQEEQAFHGADGDGDGALRLLLLQHARPARWPWLAGGRWATEMGVAACCVWNKICRANPSPHWLLFCSPPEPALPWHRRRCCRRMLLPPVAACTRGFARNAFDAKRGEPTSNPRL